MAARRIDDIAHRRTALTGVNEYPGLAEPQLQQGDPLESVARYAAGFEALRDRSDAVLVKTGSRPRVLLLALGPLAEHDIRTTFVTNRLASGGIEPVNPGPVYAVAVPSVVAEAGSLNTAVLDTTSTGEAGDSNTRWWRNSDGSHRNCGMVIRYGAAVRRGADRNATTTIVAISVPQSGCHAGAVVNAHNERWRPKEAGAQAYRVDLLGGLLHDHPIRSLPRRPRFHRRAIGHIAVAEMR